MSEHDTLPAPALDPDMAEACADDIDDVLRGVERHLEGLREVSKLLRRHAGSELVERLLAVIGQRDRRISELEGDLERATRCIERHTGTGQHPGFLRPVSEGDFT